ncbi:MAG: asparagine synthase family protein [Dehalococcoidia bacterium]
MTWIGGILTRPDVGHQGLAEKLAVMAETAFPPSRAASTPDSRCTTSVLDVAHGKALMKISRGPEWMASQHVYTDCQAKLALIYDGYLYHPENAGSGLSGTRHRVNGTLAEFLVDSLAQFPGRLDQRVREALTGLEGDYALAVGDTDQTVISRNRSGTKPLYFSERNGFSAFASNKRPLWMMGLGEVRPLRAGMIATLAPQGVCINEVSPLPESEVHIRSMTQAVNEYEQALWSATRKRLAEMDHLPRVGVLLSGGVDSCLIAKMIHSIAPHLGMNVIAYTVGLPDSPDMKSARRFAEELGMTHRMRTLSIDRIERYIPEVIEAIEDSDYVQIETGIGIYAALEMASQDGVKVIFSGQGPDEEWGGYSWYPRVLGRDGRQELDRRMRDDFARADTETLDRENKIAMAWDVDLLFPYLDTEVVNTAMSVASELKVASEDDNLGKHPHRQLAIRIGIPESYSNRGKLAIQHGTGIHGVLDAIARKNGFGPDLVKDIAYRNEEISSERMGSSSRYGYRYTQRKLWQVPQHAQFFLHTLAFKKGLLDRPVRERVAHLLERAALSSRLPV